MAKTKANEREFAGQVIHWIKEQLKEGGLPFENATNDSGLYGLASVKFPDVLLTLDFEGLRPFCGWELKTPKTDARDKELLKGAVEKAQQIEAKYFVTWNMQSAVIWRTPEKTRVTVREDDKVREFGPDTRITRVDDIRDAEKADLLRDMCRRVVLDLGRLYEDEKVNLPVADTTVFVSMVATASNKMEESLLRDIRSARGKREFARNLTRWATKQGVNKYDQEYERSLAQQIAYKIIGKILFYITLRRQNLHLPKLDLKGENYKAAMKRMRGLFQAALEVDYQAIFERDITDEIELSRDTADVVIELTDKLTHWTFEQVPLDVVGNVLERLVPEDARHSLGQYFTPDRLADLILGFCVQDGEALVMDPTCGTGTFLIRSYNRLRQLGAKRQPHHQLLDQIWGFDIAGFPAELATINLCRQDLSDYQNFPRVLAKDFFEAAPGGEFEFPPPKKMVKAGERGRVKIPRFDALVGNFPFIRQEKIEKAEPGYKQKLARALYQSWGLEYHELFPNVKKQGRGELDVELALSGQADIYAYMFFHAAAHLKVGGRMGFITSNSWLDVAYGYELQKFFLSKFKLVGIFESRCEPWFEQSAVNTVFTILERCDDEQEKANNPVYFVKVKKPLAELFPQDALIDAQGRWNAIDRFVEKIEELGPRAEVIGGAQFKRFGAINSEYVKQPEIISYEDDDIRVRIIKQGDLKKDVETAGQTVKWGQYLRGPDIYFEILEKCADRLVPLRKMAEIRRGFTTGANEFFYLTDDQVKHWGIEREFLKPVIKSPKESDTILINPSKLKYQIFMCNKSKEELKNEGKMGSLKYIKWGESQKTKERQKTRKGIPWPQIKSLVNKKHWYSIKNLLTGDFLCNRFFDQRFFFNYLAKQVVVDQTFYAANFIKDDKHKGFLQTAVLNSFLTFLSVEIKGRCTLGEGVLQYAVYEYDDILAIESLAIGRKFQERIIDSFGKLLSRPIKSIFEEVKMPDRQKLDSLVLESLGLDPKKYLRPLYDGLCELVGERLLLPKLRGAKKKRRVEQDVGKLREEVTEEILPSGVLRFPAAFVKGGAKTEWEEIGIAAEVVKLGAVGMGVQEICDGERNHLMEVRGLEKSKYIVYAKHKSEQVVKVPKSEIVIKKAVQDYEIYVRETRDKLYRAIMEKSGDHSLSENLARVICADFGLPDVR